jgi:hypothetical protein
MSRDLLEKIGFFCIFFALAVLTFVIIMFATGNIIR